METQGNKRTLKRKEYCKKKSTQCLKVAQDSPLLAEEIIDKIIWYMSNMCAGLLFMFFTLEDLVNLYYCFLHICFKLRLNLI